MRIGQFIKIYRQKNHLTLADFAKAIGVKTSIITSWENSIEQPDIKQFYEISSITGVPMHILTDEKALKNYGVPHKRIVYNIGLHTLFEAVYDVKTFLCFLDAISGATGLITPNMGLVGLLFLEHLPSNSDFDFYSDITGVYNISFDFTKQTITLELKGEIIVISSSDIISIKPCEYFNNEAYGFLFYKDNTDRPDFRLDVGICY